MCEYPEYPVWENPQYLVPVRRKSMTLLSRQLGAAPLPQLLSTPVCVAPLPSPTLAWLEQQSWYRKR
jgi:hypothetical protein